MKIYGQEVIGGKEYDEIVACHVCGGHVGLKRGRPNIPIAWFDPYNTKGGKNVHSGCLSEKRKAEVEAELEYYKKKEDKVGKTLGYGNTVV